MDELEELRLYLRLDEIDSEELPALYEAAKEYIQTSTGKRYDPNKKLMRLCAKMLTAHWYQERGMYAKSGYTEYSYSVTALLCQMKQNPDFEDLGGAADG